MICRFSYLNSQSDKGNCSEFLWKPLILQYLQILEALLCKYMYFQSRESAQNKLGQAQNESISMEQLSFPDLVCYCEIQMLGMSFEMLIPISSITYVHHVAFIATLWGRRLQADSLAFIISAFPLSPSTEKSLIRDTICSSTCWTMLLFPWFVMGFFLVLKYSWITLFW